MIVMMKSEVKAVCIILEEGSLWISIPDVYNEQWEWNLKSLIDC